jgi:hypothetical protein
MRGHEVQACLFSLMVRTAQSPRQHSADDCSAAGTLDNGV